MYKKFLACVVFGVVVLGFLACGKKGGLKPPEYLAPEAVRNFTATGSLEGVVLSWLAPEKQASGEELMDLDRFKVYRGEVQKNDNSSFEEIAEIVVNEGQESLPAKSNKIFSLTDTEAKPGKEYDYYVLPVNTGGTDGASSPVLRVRYVGESSTVRVLPPE